MRTLLLISVFTLMLTSSVFAASEGVLCAEDRVEGKDVTTQSEVSVESSTASAVSN